MNNLRNRQRKPRKENLKLLPKEFAFVVPAIQPSFPTTAHLIQELAERSAVSCNTVVSIMTTHLYTKFLPLLSNRTMPILTTPLVNALDTAGKPRLHCLTPYRPVPLLGFAPIMSETKQVERLRLPSIFPVTIRLVFTATFGVVGCPEINQLRLFRMYCQAISLNRFERTFITRSASYFNWNTMTKSSAYRIRRHLPRITGLTCFSNHSSKT